MCETVDSVPLANTNSTNQPEATTRTGAVNKIGDDGVVDYAAA